MRAAPRPAPFWIARRLGLSFGIALAVGIAAPALGFEIVATNPPRYARAIATSLSSIDVVFDATPVLPPASAFRVAGTISGLHAGQLEVAGNTLRWRDTTKRFQPGELVTVNLRQDVGGSGGGTLAGGRCFAFTIASRAVVPSWTDVTVFGTADIPYFIHGGDLDGDGTPDLAVPNEGTNDVSIFRNQSGDGSFPIHDEYAVGARPSSIFGEDLDNDGDQDLATADIIGRTVTILRNAGDGSFTPVASYPAGISTRQIHGGDFDGDNDVDLCATSRGTNQVFLLYNQGNATFTSTPMTVRGAPFAIRSGDFNGDRHLDIGVACQDADSLEVLLNNGTGGFVRNGRYQVGDGPWCLNGNDFDGDGDFDLVSVASFSNRLVLLRNDGTGKFPTRNLWATDTFPLGVFAADVDGDGDIDAMASNYDGASVGVYLNNGSGTLIGPTTLNTSLSGSYTWASDLDGDDDLDLSVVDEEMNQLFIFRNGDTATAALDEPVLQSMGPSLRVAPNPSRAGIGMRLVLSGSGAAAHVDLFDVAGRRVRRLEGGVAHGSGTVFRWDGRDGRGRIVAAGRYLAVASSAGRRLRLPFQVVP